MFKDEFRQNTMIRYRKSRNKAMKKISVKLRNGKNGTIRLFPRNSGNLPDYGSTVETADQYVIES